MVYAGSTDLLSSASSERHNTTVWGLDTKPLSPDSPKNNFPTHPQMRFILPDDARLASRAFARSGAGRPDLRRRVLGVYFV
jgi:hypothetical protein